MSDVPGRVGHFLKETAKETLGINDFKKAGDAYKRAGKVSESIDYSGDTGSDIKNVLGATPEYTKELGLTVGNAALGATKALVNLIPAKKASTVLEKFLPKFTPKPKPPQFSTPKIDPETPKIKFGKPDEGGGYFAPRGGKKPTPPGKPIQEGGSSTSRGGTTITEAPSSTRPDFNKPFDPFDNPKSNPWPNMPKVKPTPAPAPGTTPKVEPAPKTKKTKATTPWNPKSTAKPDAAKPNLKTSPSTESSAQTQKTPSTSTGRAVAFGTGAAAAVGLAALLPKPKTEEDKKWNPSAIV